MTTIPPGYETKPALYYEQSRPEMLPFIPTTCRCILDVGCGKGEFGALLRRERDCWVWGVEPFASAAADAANRLDRVIEGPFDESADLPAGTFDCVVFNDVLEHLIDPAAALQLARRVLAPNGFVVASIPNIRHFPTLWHLAIHGEWNYRDCGTLDRTHLRFFTRTSIAALFREQGFAVELLRGIHPYRGIPNASARVWRLFEVANFVSASQFDEMKYERFAIVARSPAAA